MELALQKKKEILMQHIKDRDMEEFFVVRDATDGNVVFFDGRETLENNAKIAFRMYLDVSAFNVVRINFYLLTDNAKRARLLEEVNERNNNSSFVKFFLSEDNSLNLEFTYAVLNEEFNPAFFVELLMLQLEMLEKVIYDDFMKVLA